MRILQVSCSFYPKKIGGTEVYLRALNRQLIKLGHQVFLSFTDEFYEKNGPLLREKKYTIDGVEVFVIEKNTRDLKTADIYFDSRRITYDLFKNQINRIQPDIVNFHHFSPADTITQLKVVKELKIPIILTYHTPGMTCGCENLLFLKKRVCNGKIDYKRCLVCTQFKYGIPKALAYVWASLPYFFSESIGTFTSTLKLKGRFITWLQLPWLSRKRIDRWQDGFKMVDHFIAVCQWVYDFLLENGIADEKITLCRQGIDSPLTIARKEKSTTLRLGYLGRIHPFKGIDILIKALKLLPSDYKIETFIYGSLEGKANDKYYKRLLRLARSNKKIKWLGKIADSEKFAILSQLDLLVIPSFWRETGPLVLLESWASRTAVIASNLGGMAELIKEERGGLLFNLDDTTDLAKKIERVYREPGLLERLESTIPPLRTMQEVSGEIDSIYNKVLNTKLKLKTNE